MRRFLALLLVSAPAWSAVGYSRFAHPRGDYALEYPSDWKRTFGIEALVMRPPGKSGENARVSLEGYPIDKKSPKDARAFAERLLAEAQKLKKVESDASATVDGVAARRITLIETVAPKGSYGQKLPGPLREVYVIVPAGGHYFVARLAGVGDTFARAAPEFDRIVGSLKLKK